MKNLNETWEYLSKYLTVARALEQGFSTGKYTKVLAGYAKEVVGIDVSKDFLDMATENLKEYPNIHLLLMDALNLSFENKSFGVLLNTSFHEFDLSGSVYSVNLPLKRRMLEEMVRVTNTIVFVEPSEAAVTNELFKVFNPVENHADRIKQSNDLIDSFMAENGYALIDKGDTYNTDKFPSREILENSMLEWWADIKIPETDEERRIMVDQIDAILDNAGMLNKLEVVENITYRVFRKQED